MFEQKSLDKIDGDYFNIIIADSQDVTIQSRNTGHYWYLHCAGYPTEEALVIFHKHRFKDGYHEHGHARSLRQAIKSIVRHDDYQLNVRKCVSATRVDKCWLSRDTDWVGNPQKKGVCHFLVKEGKLDGWVRDDDEQTI